MPDTILRVARAVVLTIVAAVVLAAAAPAPIGGHLGIALVQGSSMLPTYESGDLVVAFTSRSYDDGDVIVYDSGRGNVIHRIVGGDAATGFVTQGDNRADVDQWTPTRDAIIGSPVLHVPGLGATLASLRDALGPHGLLLFAMIALALALRPRRRRLASTWRDGSREAALAAFAATIVGAGIVVLTARQTDAAWSLPIGRASMSRFAVIVALLGVQVTAGAIVFGRSGHVRLRSLWTDLALGARIVDVDALDTSGRSTATASGVRALRAAADRASAPVFRTTLPDHSTRYVVVTDDVAIAFDPATPPALPFRRRTEPA